MLKFALGHRISARYNELAPRFELSLNWAYNERWQMVAMYEDNAVPAEPVEQWWYHAAGASGYGSSSYIDDVVLRDRDTTANGRLNERVYYLQNQHHDVVALCDTAGDVEERVNYDAYGSPIGAFTAVGNRKGYAGYEYDAELSSGGGETYHVRHRVYRSDLGVWTRRDPLGYVDGMNLYGYVGQSPVNAVDAEGLVLQPPGSPFDRRDAFRVRQRRWGDQCWPGDARNRTYTEPCLRTFNQIGWGGSIVGLCLISTGVIELSGCRVCEQREWCRFDIKLKQWRWSHQSFSGDQRSCTRCQSCHSQIDPPEPLPAPPAPPLIPPNTPCDKFRDRPWSIDACQECCIALVDQTLPMPPLLIPGRTPTPSMDLKTICKTNCTGY